MKKTIQLLFMLLALVFSHSAFGFDLVFNVLSTPQGKEIKLITENTKHNDGTIILRNINQSVFYKEALALGANAVKMDLSQLPIGQYELALVLPEKEIIQPIRIKTDKILIPHYLRKEIFAPVLQFHDGILYMTLRSSRVQAVRVDVIDENGNTLLAEAFLKPAHFTKRYNLQKLESGRYVFHLEIEGRTYEKIIER